MARRTLLQWRRDTAANWGSANPVLSVGEPGYDTTNRGEKIGDGSTAWAALPFYEARGIHNEVPGSIVNALALGTTAQTILGSTFTIPANTLQVGDQFVTEVAGKLKNNTAATAVYTMTVFPWSAATFVLGAALASSANSRYVYARFVHTIMALGSGLSGTTSFGGRSDVSTTTTATSGDNLTALNAAMINGGLTLTDTTVSNTWDVKLVSSTATAGQTWDTYMANLIYIPKGSLV